MKIFNLESLNLGDCFRSYLALFPLSTILYFLLCVGNSSTEDNNNKRHVDDLDVQMYDLVTIVKATNNFSTENIIGEGGFGRVYKVNHSLIITTISKIIKLFLLMMNMSVQGIIDSQEIAVKTLSRNSWQGVTEFINEVNLTAKLQHRNLVKLLGCCIEGEERMLIYQYMENGSLDSLIFGKENEQTINWVANDSG